MYFPFCLEKKPFLLRIRYMLHGNSKPSSLFFKFRIVGLPSPWIEKPVELWNATKSNDNRTVLLSLNHYPDQNSGLEIARVLLKTEPSVTWPLNLKASLKEYDLIFQSASGLKDMIEQPWLNGPSPDFDNLPQFDREAGGASDKIVMLSANKLSLVKGELYSLRRIVIRTLGDKLIVYGHDWSNTFIWKVKKLLAEVFISLRFFTPISLSGGRLWFNPKPPSVVGPIESKFQAHRGSRYALVIENSMELRTEKLYQAIEAGAFPVYVGPEIEDDIPKELFVHSEPRGDAVLEAIEKIKSLDYGAWGSAREKWLKSRNYTDSQEDRVFSFLTKVSLLVATKILTIPLQAKDI